MKWAAGWRLPDKYARGLLVAARFAEGTQALSALTWHICLRAKCASRASSTKMQSADRAQQLLENPPL